MSKVKAKPWYKSKTLLCNSAAAAVTVIAASAPMVQALLTPPVYLGFIGLMAFLNTFLRLITTEPIADVPGAKP